MLLLAFTSRVGNGNIVSMTRDEDDTLPKAKEPQVFPRKLEGLAVAVMQAYIVELEAEIVKVRVEIARRGDVRAQAESLFN